MGETRTVIPNSRGVVTRRETCGAQFAERVIIDSHTQKIAADAFRNFKCLREVDVPVYVRGIGKGAFKGCASLERVRIAYGCHLAYIDADAFSGCRALREIHFPSRLHNIGSCAFQKCESLRRISMGQMVDEIGAFAFTDVPVFKGFFEAVSNGLPSSDLLRCFRALMRGVPHAYSMRSIAFSWTKRSLDKLMPSRVRDWPMTDFVKLLDLLAAMPFYPTSDPQSPVGHVERTVLRFLEDKAMPRTKRAMIVRYLMIQHEWPAWKDVHNGVDKQWEQRPEWKWNLLPDAFCDNEDFRDWCSERNPPAWHNFKMGTCPEGMMEKMLQCAEKNEWANFLLLAGVCGTESVLRVFCHCIVDKNAVALAFIVRACAKAQIQLPLRELVFECIGWDPAYSIDILKAVEDAAPGMCAALYDRFGRGLLWYSTYLNPETIGLFEPFSRQNSLAQYLLRIGCDPARENVNGLAWQDMVDA